MRAKLVPALLVAAAAAAAVAQPAAAATTTSSFSDSASGLKGTYTVTVTRISAVALRVRTESTFDASQAGRLTIFSGCTEIYCSIESWPFEYRKGSNRLVFEMVASGMGNQFDNSGGGSGGAPPGTSQSLIDQLLSGLPVLGPIVDPVLGPIVDPIIGGLPINARVSRVATASRHRSARKHRRHRAHRLTRHQRKLRAARRRKAAREAGITLAQIQDAASTQQLLPVNCGESSMYVPGVGQATGTPGICVP
jgi:hypothetical protein